MTAEVCKHPWKFAVDPFRMIGGLFFVGTRAVSSHLVDSGDGLILIDCGYPQTVYLLLESIRRLNYDPRDIRVILNTHAHYDHIGGTRALKELSGAEVCLGAGDVELVSSRAGLTEAELAGCEFYETFDVDRPLRDGDTVRLGSVSVRCVAAPGHTPGTMAFFFDVAHEGRTYLAGLHGGPGTATLRDEYLDRHGLPHALRDQYRDSLARLKAMPVAVHLGAHPAQAGTFPKRDALAENPMAFVDPAGWPAYLDGLQRAFRKRFP